MFFKPLDKKQIGEIVRLLAKDLTKRLLEKQIKLTLSDKAVAYIVENGYDANFGARPLKRYLQRKLETVIAKKLLEGAFTTGDEILVDADENGLTLQKA